MATSNQLAKRVWCVFFLNEIEAKMFCHYYVNFPNSKNENSSCRKGNKNFQADGRRANKIFSGAAAAQQPGGGTAIYGPYRYVPL